MPTRRDDHNDHITDWTTATLKRYIIDLMEAHDRRYEERFIAQEKSVMASINATERAVTKAEEAQQRVNASQNEFRGALKDQAQTFATRIELLPLDDRIKKLENAQATLGGRATITSILWAVVVSLFTAVTAALIVSNMSKP